MEKQTKKRHLPFLTSKAKAQQLYAVSMNEDDFIEMAYDIWRSLGNIATKLTRYFIKVPADYIIELPFQCEFIDSVSLVDKLDTMSTFDSGGRKDRHVPSVSVRSNLPGINESVTSTKGMSVNYITVGEHAIKITSTDTFGTDIMIVYRALDLDTDNLPLLNDKEVEAIAAEVARRDLVRKAFMGVGLKDKSHATLLQYIVGEATRLMAAAKITENINDDNIDKLLDIKTSWDRKQYKRRFNLLN